MKKLKNIKFELDIEGQGVVNFDGDDQKYMGIKGISSRHDNVSYAKKNLYLEKDKEGNDVLNYKLKISSNALRAAIFSGDYIAHTPSIVHNDLVLSGYLASDFSVIRGYLTTLRNYSFNKTSPLNLTDAEQINNAVSKLETFTRSGQKQVVNENEVKEVDDKKDTSYFKKETVGHISYRTKGNIDLENLEIISCDSIYDRLAFNEDMFTNMERFFQMNGTTGNLSYYQMVGNVSKIPERLFHLDQNSRMRLIKKTLRMLLDLEIKKTNAYAERAELRVKLIYDALNEDAWITISSYEDIDKLFSDVELYDFYFEENDKEKIELIDVLAKGVADNAKKAKSKKKTTKTKKDEVS